MHSGPITIDDIAGPITIDSNFWTGRHRVMVGPYVAPSVGRKQFALPTTDGGTVEATVRSSMLSPFPTVEIAGVRHATGPEIPGYLKVLIALPLVLLVGGLLGGLIGACGLLINSTIAQRDSGNAAKALLMVGVLVGAGMVFLTLAGAIYGARQG